jgi:hypothetical protein
MEIKLTGICRLVHDEGSYVCSTALAEILPVEYVTVSESVFGDDIGLILSYLSALVLLYYLAIRQDDCVGAALNLGLGDGGEGVLGVEERREGSSLSEHRERVPARDVQ